MKAPGNGLAAKEDATVTSHYWRTDVDAGMWMRQSPTGRSTADWPRSFFPPFGRRRRSAAIGVVWRGHLTGRLIQRLVIARLDHGLAVAFGETGLRRDRFGGNLGNFRHL